MGNLVSTFFFIIMCYCFVFISINSKRKYIVSRINNTMLLLVYKKQMKLKYFDKHKYNTVHNNYTKTNHFLKFYLLLPKLIYLLQTFSYV